MVELKTKEEQFSRRELPAKGVKSALAAFFIAGSAQGITPVESDFPNYSSKEIEGEGFSIKKIAQDIFKIKGDTQENALVYISERCIVKSVGTWSLQGVYGSEVDEHVVTVDDGTCIPEITVFST